jgi:hypothetical protein
MSLYHEYVCIYMRVYVLLYVSVVDIQLRLNVCMYICVHIFIFSGKVEMGVGVINVSYLCGESFEVGDTRTSLVT